tara:strand:- start:32348 stop:33118 length:771 start_codon:yes stop_codon:yes gene_type:complete
MKEHIKKLLDNDLREDGRKLLEYRKNIKVEYGISPKSAEGSAQVTIGDTVVVAGVKFGVGTPFPDTPDEGVMIVGAELIPFSSPDFESGPPSIVAIELSRVVDRAIRESGCLDTKKLCIKKGEVVWTVFVDMYPLNDDGNLFDAMSLAAIAAMKDAKFPDYDKKTGKVNYTKRTKTGLPLKGTPLECTVIKIKDKLLLDPSVEEWKALDARLTVGFLDNGNICAMQKGGEKSLSVKEISKMVEIAGEQVKKLRKVL